MKSINSYLATIIMVALSSVVLFSCSKEEEDHVKDIVDYDTYPIYVYITDVAQNDLLNQSWEYCIPLDKISVLCHGKVYEANSYIKENDACYTRFSNQLTPEYTLATRANLPLWYGPVLLKDSDGMHCLYIGEFSKSPSSSYDMHLIIDNTAYDFKFTCDEFTLDGTPIKDLKHVRIVYPKQK